MTKSPNDTFLRTYPLRWATHIRVLVAGRAERCQWRQCVSTHLIPIKLHTSCLFMIAVALPARYFQEAHCFCRHIVSGPPCKLLTLWQQCDPVSYVVSWSCLQRHLGSADYNLQLQCRMTVGECRSGMNVKGNGRGGWWLKIGHYRFLILATRYGLNGPRIESQWGRDFPHLSRPALRPTQSPIQWVPGLSQGLSDWGVALNSHPHLAPRLKKEYSYTSTPPFGLRGLL